MKKKNTKAKTWRKKAKQKGEGGCFFFLFLVILLSRAGEGHTRAHLGSHRVVGGDDALGGMELSGGDGRAVRTRTESGGSLFREVMHNKRSGREREGGRNASSDSSQAASIMQLREGVVVGRPIVKVCRTLVALAARIS